MNVQSIEKKDCCGCTACAYVCPTKAIEMKPDEKGFIYPIVNERCINCGMCVKVCEDKKSYNTCYSGYAVKNTDKEVLDKSSSGGVSYALCKAIIDMGGVVYGVAYTDDYQVVTKRAQTIEECYAFYGSKYVQTNPEDTFAAAFEDLKNGKRVLYFGTSCHIAGLYSFLKTRKCSLENLYTVDLICHGVPSPLLFKEYIDFLRKDGRGFEGFSFRTKKFPWGYGSANFGCTIYWKNNKCEVETARSKIFLKLFFSNNCLREYCHTCPYAGINKPADLTIADYWGIKDEHPEFYDSHGVSAVLVQTKKGEELLKNLQDVDLLESSIDKIKRKQGNLNVPSPKNPESDVFWEKYHTHGFEEIAKDYGGYNFEGKLKSTRLYNLYFRMRKKIPSR